MARNEGPWKDNDRLCIGLSDHELAIGLSFATDAAHYASMKTWIVDVEGNPIAAIVPVAVAEAYNPGPCAACKDDRHEDCENSGDGVLCRCDKRSLHGSIVSRRVLAYRTRVAGLRRGRT
jgi:hypothetical protein